MRMVWRALGSCAQRCVRSPVATSRRQVGLGLKASQVPAFEREKGKRAGSSATF